MLLQAEQVGQLRLLVSRCGHGALQDSLQLQ
jgi:hypothetical protein